MACFYKPAKPPLDAFKIMRAGLTLLNRRRKSNPRVSAD